MNRKNLAIFGITIFALASIGFVLSMQMVTAGSLVVIKGHSTVLDPDDHPASALEHDACQPSQGADGVEYQQQGELHFYDDNGNDVHDHGSGTEPAESTLCLIVGEI